MAPIYKKLIFYAVRWFLTQRAKERMEAKLGDTTVPSGPSSSSTGDSEA